MIPERRRRWLLGCGLSWLLGFVVGAPGSTAAPLEARQLTGSWRLQSPAGEGEGVLVALVGGDSWRIDLAVVDLGSPEAMAQLRRRLGDGWTLASAAAEGGLLQPWHAPWRRFDHGTARAVGALLERWAAGPPVPSRSEERRRWRSATRREPAELHWPDLQILGTPPPASATAQGAWRRRLVVRGRGRGGDELRLQLRWEGRQLVATTTRWPGRLEIAPASETIVRVPPEAFLVLWPLAEVLP